MMNKNSKMNRSLRRNGLRNERWRSWEPLYQGLSFRVKTCSRRLRRLLQQQASRFPKELEEGQRTAWQGWLARSQASGKPTAGIQMARSWPFTWQRQRAPNQEATVQNYIQQWKKVGLHVTLTTGRLIEFNSFYDKVETTTHRWRLRGRLVTQANHHKTTLQRASSIQLHCFESAETPSCWRKWTAKSPSTTHTGSRSSTSGKPTCKRKLRCASDQQLLNHCC